jgi:hypothetical protein
MPQVFVGGHDADLLDLVAEKARSRRQTVVGFILFHRPDYDADGAHGVFHGVELRA